ncbi:hypothetical protein BC828DRAFT_378106 [Blastocladiella britannica]|nr:hypothetical protein BC828DRAFT_378106 [Blastocladiella britannica]
MRPRHGPTTTPSVRWLSDGGRRAAAGGGNPVVVVATDFAVIVTGANEVAVADVLTAPRGGLRAVVDVPVGQLAAQVGQTPVKLVDGVQRGRGGGGSGRGREVHLVFVIDIVMVDVVGIEHGRRHHGPTVRLVGGRLLWGRGPQGRRRGSRGSRGDNGR